MDPRDFLRQAQELAEGKPAADFGKRAVDCRTAISRAYFAGFDVAVAFLTSMSIALRRGPDSHKDVQRCLENCDDPEVMRVGAELSDLRTSRNSADYHLDRTDVENRKSALFLINKAEATIRALDTCTSPSRRSAIAAAVLAYRKNVLRLP